MTLAAKARGLVVVSSVWLVSSPALAQAGAGVFDDVETRFHTAAAGWATLLTGYATTLFVALATISMVMTFGLMAVRRADLGELLSELIRFAVFTGFMLWLLRNGPAIGDAIIRSMQQMGQAASGSAPSSPSGIVDVGFQILDRMIAESTFFEPIDSAIGIVMSLVILIVLGLVGVNMLLLLISGWILAYGGVFFLGFGGSRWTSDFAINYFKTLLGVAAALFGMVLIVGIGKSVLDSYYAGMTATITLRDMAVMLLVAVVLLVLVNKIPNLIAGILTGASVGAVHAVGSAGAGTALAAGGLAGAAVATGGAALAAGAANVAGGVSAIRAAYSAAQSGISGGDAGAAGSTGAGSNPVGGGPSGPSGSSGSTVGATPLAVAAGDSGGGGRPRSSSSPIGNLVGAMAGETGDAWRARVARTPGGRVAQRIRTTAAAAALQMPTPAPDLDIPAPGPETPAPAPQFDGDAIAAGGPANDEVAAFVNKGRA